MLIANDRNVRLDLRRVGASTIAADRAAEKPEGMPDANDRKPLIRDTRPLGNRALLRRWPEAGRQLSTCFRTREPFVFLRQLDGPRRTNADERPIKLRCARRLTIGRSNDVHHPLQPVPVHRLRQGLDRAELALMPASATKLTMTTGVSVPCALWRAQHVLRAVPPSTSRRVRRLPEPQR